MSHLATIGQPPWTHQEVLDGLDAFAEVYANRPIGDNRGGMRAPHLFALWFMARKLSPDLIVESGVWRGQSTWLLETACPQAKLICIDLDLSNREYVSKNAIYDDRDFSEQDWSMITDRSLAFFDDHQNAYKRLQQCRWFGFKHAIFEDNYPATHGDCYSLKKAFAHAGFASTRIGQSTFLRRLVRQIGLALLFLSPQYEVSRIYPNEVDARVLRKNLEVYAEFPPVFKPEKTRWGDDWDEQEYPTPLPLLGRPEKPSHQLFLDEAMWYTWICYAKLK